MADTVLERADAADAAARRALLGSIGATASIGALGLVLGLVANSQMILFDALYAVVGVGVSWLLLRASALSAAGPTRSYPYGRQAATPLAIGIQGVSLLVALLYAVAVAVGTIRDGGAEIIAGVATVYAVISTAASVGVYLWMRPAARRSELVMAEATAWRVAAWRGVGMVVAFLAIWGLQRAGRHGVAGFIDPAMVIVTCIAFLPDPVRLIRTTIVELMEGAPPAAVQQPVLDRVDAVRHELGLPEARVRMTKVGPKLYVEIDMVVPPSTTVGEEDRVRGEMRRRMRELPYEVWLNVELSADPSWGA